MASTPIAARMVSGNFAGLAVANTTLTRSGFNSLKAQAVWGSAMYPCARYTRWMMPAISASVQREAVKVSRLKFLNV